MKIRTFILLLIALIIFVPKTFARAPNGFHEGPYILLTGGIVNFSADNNVRTGTKVGRDYEPAIGFDFGWSLKDYIAPELQVRYSTDKNHGKREHIVNVNMNAVYSFITDQLTSNESIYFLPFVQVGPMAQIAAVPGDPDAGDHTLGVWGLGISAGGGMKILFKEYGYAGILGQLDLVNLTSKHQTIGGVSTKVIDGGWDAQVGASAVIGVHF